MFEYVVVTYRKMNLFGKPIPMNEPGQMFVFSTFEKAMGEMDYQIQSGNEAEIWCWDGEYRRWYRILFAGAEKHWVSQVWIG